MHINTCYWLDKSNISNDQPRMPLSLPSVRPSSSPLIIAAPSPAPSPATSPAPSPATSPAPSPATSPAPSSSRSPEWSSTPSAARSLSLASASSPTPTPASSSTPTPASSPAPTPASSPTPTPASSPTPTPASSPVPSSALSLPPFLAPPYPLSLTSSGSEHIRSTKTPPLSLFPKSQQRREGLHLNEVTWDNIDQLQAPPDQRYEIVNGNCVIMTTERRRHNEAISRLGHLIMLLLGIDVRFAPSHQVQFNLYEDRKRSKPCVRVPDWAFQFKSGNENTPGRSSSSSTRTPSPSHSPPLNQTPSSSSNSHTSSKSTLSRERMLKAQRLMRFTVGNDANVVIEYTSEKTRDTDMTEKWVEYAFAGIDIYIIIDSHDVLGDKRSHVVIGHLDQSLNRRAKQQLTAFPERVKGSKFNEFFTLATQYKSELYFKPVFTEDDVIKIGFFEQFNFKANEKDSPTYLRKRLELEWEKRKFSQNKIQQCRDFEERSKQILQEHQEAMLGVRSELANALKSWETERLAKEAAISDKENERLAKENGKLAKEAAISGKEKERLAKKNEKRSRKKAERTAKRWHELAESHGLILPCTPPSDKDIESSSNLCRSPTKSPSPRRQRKR